MIYMFDIDGTLTLPRQRMDQQFEKLFLRCMHGKTFFLVTGSDIAKVREQVSESVLAACKGMFTCMGNEFHRFDKLVYRNQLELPQELIGWLEQQVHFSDCPVKTNNFLEFRPGMLNFSVVGRQATLEQRQQYYEWDKLNGERKRISNYINHKYPELEACVGGQISIDIQARGKNKSQAYHWVKKNYDEPVYFFGDKCYDGGNDSAIVEEIEKPDSNDFYLNVTGPEEVLVFLNELEDTCLDI